MSQDFHYVGGELELFAGAENWKRYLASQVTPYLGKRVLEVGAGLGSTTRAFCDGGQRTWVALEPDVALAERAALEVSEGRLPVCCEVRVGTLADIPQIEVFDSILYIDVLEHIEDDVGELRRAAAHVDRGGHLVVLSPAHAWLYSPFDASIGHFRRYGRAALRGLTPAGLRLVQLRALDAAGLMASLANRVLLRQSMPTVRQVTFWDRRLVPISRVLDGVLGHRLGKSLLAIWKREDDAARSVHA